MRRKLSALILVFGICCTLNASNISNSGGGGGGGGSGTVTSVSVVTANGVSGTVANATSTPAITLTLGAITPTTDAPSGLTGATAASRYVGATTSGAPTASSPFLKGDFVIDQTGFVWICTTAGSPGTWTSNASTVTTNANLTGDVTSVGNTTTVAEIQGVSVGTPTGTGNVVMSASPTLTGTLTASAITGSGILTVSTAGASSASPVTFTGTPFVGSGTTSTPILYLNGGTAPTTWNSTASGGSYLGFNGISGFAGNYIDVHANGGGSIFSVNSTGTVTSNRQFVTPFAGAASVAVITTLSQPFSGGNGTTTFPQWFSSASTATAKSTWSTSGTVFGANVHTSVGNFEDYAVDGTSQWTVSGTGALTTGTVPFSALTTASNTTSTMTVGSGGAITFSGSGIVNANELGGTSIGTPTGTGNVVYSASPTLTGTLTCATVTASGVISTSQAAALSSSTGAAFTMTSTTWVGTSGTGTTAVPFMYLNGGTAPTTWSASGTGLGLNAPSGFAGNFLDLHLNGSASVFKIASTGIMTIGAGASFNGSLINSFTGLGSTSVITTTGVVYSAGNGTTNYPQWLSNWGTIGSVTNWSNGANNGTVFGMNGPSTFTGNFVDYRLSSTTVQYSVAYNGTISQNGKTATYNGITTAGWGNPAVYGSGRSTAQTAAVASVATYTVGAADGSFEVGSNVNLTASTTNSFTVTCAYTDETNTSRTLTFSFVQAGVATPIQTITNVTGVGAYCGMPMRIRAKASTAITIATTGTFASVTYNVEGDITQID